MKRIILLKILIIMLFSLLLTNIFFPIYSNAISLDNIIKKGDNFAGTNLEVDTGFSQTGLQKTSKEVYNILLTIAVVVAIIVGIILGIQWMIASVEEKAKIKEMLIPYVVGCIVAFGAFSIWKIIVDLAQT